MLKYKQVWQGIKLTHSWINSTLQFTFVGELYHGSRNYKGVSPYLQLTLSIFQQNEVGKEMLWMKRFFQELGLMQDKYVVHFDSQSAIDLSKNVTFHSCLKHIEVRYH